MPFEKGHKQSGSRKGVPNKDKRRFKVALSEMFEEASDDMIEWLNEIEDPKDRFDVIAKFAEFLYPKLARNENNVTINDLEWLEKVKEPRDKEKISDPEK